MNFSEYRQYDAVGLADLIRRKEVSSDEVFQAALNRLDEVNPKLNLLAHDLRERAIKEKFPQHNKALLSGVPFLLKDLLSEWENTPMWSGSAMMRGHISAENSVLTQAYLNAGLRIFGKTTTSEWGLMPYTETELHGETRNPWHTDYTAGGSSGGAAAAVAAGIVPMAHGGDGGGSIRLPAHHCGVLGLKPSRGRVAAANHESWQGLVSEHVLTRSVRDSALMLDIAARTYSHSLYRCPPAPVSLLRQNPRLGLGLPENGQGIFSGCLNVPLPRLKIAVHTQSWLGGETQSPIKQVIDNTIKLLENAGHMVVAASPQFASAEMLRRAMLVLVAGETARMAYVFERQLGRVLTWRDVEPATWAILVQGRQVSAGEMAWARGMMLAQQNATDEFFREYDALLSPVCPRTTPKIGELAPTRTQNRLSSWLLGRLNLGAWLNTLIAEKNQQLFEYIGFTAPFNMSGSPAMSVPLGEHDGLPIGVQFAAAWGREDILLRLAAELAQIQPWHDKQPNM